MVTRGMIAILLAATLAGCGKKTTGTYVTMEGFALGTTYSITVNAADTTGLRASVDSLFRATDASMSIYNPESLLSRINRNETDSVDAHITRCIEIARTVSQLTGGVYDITVKPLTDVWGFGAREGGGEEEMPDINAILQYVGYNKIHIADGRIVKDDPRTELDLNSIAKGYITDLLGGMVHARGIGDYIVEVGGEIVCRGHNSRGIPWVVGIDRPADGNMVSGADMQAMISFTNAGLATSGNYRRYHTDAEGRKVVHTLNALTGMSVPGNLLSATVIAADCATADALATALMAVGLERATEILETNPQWAGYLIYTDNGGEFKEYVSPRMKQYILEN